MKCIILAGGFATRLWPLTEKTPKPLLNLAGKPLLSHIAEKIPAEVEIFVSVNSRFADDFENWKKDFKGKNKVNVFIEDANNEDEKLGALFSVATCIKENKINDDLLLVAGDNYFDFSVEQFIATFDKSPLVAVFDIQNKEEAKKFGVVVGQNGVVNKFMEKPDNPPSTLVSTGCSIIPQELLKNLCDYAEVHRDNLGGVFEHFLQKKISVEYFAFSEKWFDIGSFNDFLRAHQHLVTETVLEGDNVKKNNCEFLGAVFLGKNTELDNVLIENSIILDGARVKNSEIRNSVVGQNAVIFGVDLNKKIIRDKAFISL